jgi:colicin import membrane protein
MAARTTPGNTQAGALALLVHLGFFALLMFGFSWQKQEPEAVVVDLWSALPVSPRSAPPPKPEPVKVEPAKPEPRVESKPPPKAEPAKPDIALKAKPEEKKRPEPKPREETPKKPAVEKKPVPEQRTEPDREALLQKQLELINKQQVDADLARQAAANQSVIGEYKGRIKRKIRGFLNRQPCGDGNPQLEFEIALLPTGQLRGNPILRKGSGLPACDRAVENAIFQADPLPVPPQPEIFSEFRNLHLIIRPNDPND